MSKEIELNVYLASIHKALSNGDHDASTVSDAQLPHLLKTLAIRYICEDLSPFRKKKEEFLERMDALHRYSFITGTENQVVAVRRNGGTWLDGDLATGIVEEAEELIDVLRMEYQAIYRPNEELLRLQREQREKENYIDNNVMIPGFDLTGQIEALESISSDIKKCIAKQEENKLKVMKAKYNG